MRAHRIAETIVGKETILEGHVKSRDMTRIPVKILVDSGANIDCVSENIANQTEVRINPKNSIKIKGFAGEGRTIGTCELEMVLPDGTEDVFTAHILPGKQHYDIILGTTSFERLNLVLMSDGQGGMKITTDKELIRKTTKGENISPIEKRKNGLMDLMKEEFPQVFKDHLELPRSREVDLRIDLKPGSSPVALKPYRFPITQLDELRTQLDELLRKGMINHSQSEWAAPCRFVKKKDTLIPRLVCDYRQLNNQTKTQRCPIPRPEEFYHKLTQSKIFSKIDLRSGFNQIRIKEENREVTAFITPFGLFQWNVVPFGLKNGPSNFMSFMYRILNGLIGKSLIVYMDDVLVFSENYNDHLHHLRELFQRLEENGVIIHERKTNLGAETVEFLGRELSNRGIRPKEEKIKEITNIDKPTTIKGLQRFCNVKYYISKGKGIWAGIAQWDVLPTRNQGNRDRISGGTHFLYCTYFMNWWW